MRSESEENYPEWVMGADDQRRLRWIEAQSATVTCVSELSGNTYFSEWRVVRSDAWGEAKEVLGRGATVPEAIDAAIGS
ncbi:hypothetical protein P3W85_43330 [Cupriavidus basilensis]|uniref:Uncharacterized protein n=1 Tax=Cupriavidus basilensis TaxID=68895 RepID=A0ABT6B4S7_9BURK|nr:hypothetical protein [Cupriavidus basilensis]MDF3839724.1 hypothetical protein [Cupriavidus basilensis]